MIKTIKGAAALFAVLTAVSLMLCLFGCEREDETVKNGIDVEEAPADPVSENTKQRANNIIRGLVSLYYRENNEYLNSQELEEITDRTVEITLGEGLSEAEYAHFLNVMEQKGEALVSMMASGSLSNEEDVDSVGSIFFALTEQISADYFGSIAYELLIMNYDRKIEKQLSMGAAYNNVLAARFTAEKDTMINHIGKQSFAGIVRLCFFVRGFFVEGSFDPNAADRFTDAELLILIKNIDFSGINADKEGYKLLVGYYCKSLVGKEEKYYSELIYKANGNGDIDEIAAALPSVLTLAALVTESLRVEDVGLVREGDTEALLSSVFERFGQEEWRIFEEITSVTVSSEDYNKIAEQMYPDDFSEYKNSLEAVGLDALKSSVGNDDFYNTLEGYIFGISPAFSYGMRK